MRLQAVLSWVGVVGVVACGGNSSHPPAKGDAGDAGTDVGPVAEAGSDVGAPTDAPSESMAAPEAGDAGEAGPPFPIGQLPGLVLWLDASQGVLAEAGGVVESWKDQSSKGDDVSSFTGMSSLLANVIHGFPAVVIPASSALSGPANSANFTWSTDDFLVEGIAIFGTGTGTLFVCANSGGNGVSLGVATSEAWTQVGDGNLPAVQVMGSTDIAGQPHLIGVARTSAGIDLRVDGVAQHVAAPTPADIHGTPVLGGGGVTVTVAELVVVHGTTSAADLAGLEGALKGKYGI